MEQDYQYLVQSLNSNYNVIMPNLATIASIAKRRIELYYNSDNYLLEFLTGNGGLTSKGDISPDLCHKNENFPTLHKALVITAIRLMYIRYKSYLDTKLSERGY